MAGKVPTTVTTSAAGVTSISARAPAVALEHTPTRQGNAIQGNTAIATAPSRASPRTVNGSTTLKGISIGSTATVTLSHLLGRAYVGWHAHSSIGGPAVLWAATSPDPTRYLVLTNFISMAITFDVDIW